MNSDGGSSRTEFATVFLTLDPLTPYASSGERESKELIGQKKTKSSVKEGKGHLRKISVESKQ